MQNMKRRRAAPQTFSQPSPESSRTGATARPREGVGSSSGRVSAAIKKARALIGEDASSTPTEPDVAVETSAGLEQVYAARRERELMFEQQARRLEAMLRG